MSDKKVNWVNTLFRRLFIFLVFSIGPVLLLFSLPIYQFTNGLAGKLDGYCIGIKSYFLYAAIILFVLAAIVYFVRNRYSKEICFEIAVALALGGLLTALIYFGITPFLSTFSSGTGCASTYYNGCRMVCVPIQGGL